MKRRDLLAGLLSAPLLRAASPPIARPHLLIGNTDPFTGIALLKLRYAAGARPSDELAGWALSWQLTKEEGFAQRAIEAMRSQHLPAKGRASRTWVEYARWSLAFDWLFDYPGFDQGLKDRVATELVTGAAAVLALPDLANPAQASYHNYSLRYLALAAFSLAAVQVYADFDSRCRAMREQAARAFANILDITNLVDPDGSYHESMDYMRITWASLVLLCELHRTTAGIDPAQHHSLFRSIGATYLYKLLPDGTPSRENDQEFPILDPRDTTVLSYAINRFKDPYAAWLVHESGFFPQQWVLPVLEFLWDDRQVVPRNPALADERELPRQRFFSGVGQLVMRSGWKPGSTWIEFDCGPYFAKHQHLDQNQFTIYHKGYLAIDSGADYTDIESPHYLNYYRRTIAHNSILVYDPAEKFFWSENKLPAANDGGQRMNSSRFWNTVRSLEDWHRTRDLWALGEMRTTDYVPGQYHYALGDATNAYSPEKLRRFTRELVYIPENNLLFVSDHVISTNPAFHKAWLLHGVEQPVVHDDTFRFRHGEGELLIHSLLPRDRVITPRGGPGNEFYTPGNEQGGPWGSGENWPIEPAEGGPLPTDPRLRHMWKTFWGEDFDRILKSNHQKVYPGAWRIEVSPAKPSEEDLFLHVLEIGGAGETGGKRVSLIEGYSFTGAAFESGPIVLFGQPPQALNSGEVTLPDLHCQSLILTGLDPNALYELNFSGPNTESPSAQPPGVPVARLQQRANEKGIVRVSSFPTGDTRLRITRSSGPSR